MSLSFHPSNFYLLFVSSMIILLLWVLKSRNQKENKWDYVILSFIGASFLFTAPFADSFLNTWDEQFHALIAWRMSHDNSILPYLYPAGWPASLFTNHWWTSTQLWLHKPPLFLWVMSWGFEVFGNHFWAGRIPSYLFAISLTSIAYKTLINIGINRFTSIFTTSVLSFSFIIYEWVSGRASLDHNDIMVIFFCSASLLCYLQSLNDKRYAPFWALLMAAGVLSKSLPGYLPLAFFILHSILSNIVYRIHIISALMSIFIPAIWWFFAWQLQSDSQSESWSYVIRHLTQAVEGHEGPLTFYLTSLSEMHAWGYFFPAMIMIGAVLLVLKAETAVNRALGMITLFVLIFYSLVPTKMPAYPLIAFLPMVCAIAYLMQFVFAYIQNRWVHMVLLMSFAWGSAQPTVIVQTHRADRLASEWTTHKLKEQREIINRLDSFESAEQQIWLNVPQHSNIIAMFGRPHIIAVNDTSLTDSQAEALKNAGYQIHVW